MSGPAFQNPYVIGAVIVFQLFLSWFLLGPDLAIILSGFTALGIVLSPTPSPKTKRGTSRKTSHPSVSSRSKSALEGVTVRRKAAFIPTVPVTPDTPEFFRPLKKKNLKALGARNLSRTFAEEQ